MKNINLNNYSGEEFESLCQQILDNIYDKVELTPLVNDKGKDLIITHNSKKIFVECKRWSNSVGRDVVQKFHSAMITAKVKRGIIITTSRLSKPAKDYIKEDVTDCEIESIEFEELKELGAKHGYNIFWEEEDIIVDEIKQASEQEIKNIFETKLKIKLKAHPKSIADYLAIKDRKTTYATCYKVDYSVDTLYKSQATKYRINEESYIYFDEQGKPLGSRLTRFLESAEGKEVSENAYDFSSKEEELKSKTIEKAINRHSERIRYKGKNNVTYRKKVVPKKKDVTICGVEKIKYPKDKINLKVSNQVIEAAGYFNGLNRLVRSESNIRSEYTNKRLNNGVLCSDCGKIADKPETGESYSCNKCDKLICYDDSYYYTFLKLFNRFTCEECAQEMNRDIGKISERVDYQKKFSTVTAYFWVILIVISIAMGYIMIIV
ncbi:restriction endonuclease [Natroniella sulfidigena]|uniref:restriction endonuclease n=1 Tax=Natroniella sulfidigena TaxID=723921 RepID=UPI00200A2698|nr:restriction endonuclease [Natroniella sulfidigena]MCK8816746.1 restriction endonuclease [Natroniella sulfidigena]